MIFKEIIIPEYINGTTNEGLRAMFKNLEYWIDVGQNQVHDRIEQLTKQLEYDGGLNKFCAHIRKFPAIKHFLKKHKAELSGDLLTATNWLDL